MPGKAMPLRRYWVVVRCERKVYEQATRSTTRAVRVLSHGEHDSKFWFEVQFRGVTHKDAMGKIRQLGLLLEDGVRFIECRELRTGETGSLMARQQTIRVTDAH